MNNDLISQSKYSFSDGRSLPRRVAPDFTIVEKTPVAPKKTSKRVDPR
jgi:hypothetical protein